MIPASESAVGNDDTANDHSGNSTAPLMFCAPGDENFICRTAGLIQLSACQPSSILSRIVSRLGGVCRLLRRCRRGSVTSIKLGVGDSAGRDVAIVVAMLQLDVDHIRRISINPRVSVGGWHRRSEPVLECPRDGVLLETTSRWDSASCTARSKLSRSDGCIPAIRGSVPATRCGRSGLRSCGGTAS